MKLLALCLIIGIAFVLKANAKTDKIICYYGSWANYRTGDAEAKIEHLNPNLCTHMIYTFVGINEQGDVTLLDTWLDIDLKGLERVVELKKINTNLKVLVAIGGWNQGSAVFSKVVGNPTLREKFVNNAYNFVTKYGFDGFDLDWEYPAQRDGNKSSDKKNFISLIKELRAKFGKALLLTAAVGATQKHRDASYDVPQMSRYLDFINVMSYDLHYYEDRYTGFNAPLYDPETEKSAELNVNDIVEGWIKDGAAPEKLILGLGFYGKTYTLSDSSDHGVGVPTTGPGNEGDYTKQAGVLSYLEICKKIKFDKWKTEWDDVRKVPYAFKGNQWVGYDNAASLDLKVDLAVKKNLGGVMMWSIEQDDIHNTCGDGHYPLLTALNKKLQLNVNNNGGFVPPTRPSTATTARPAKPHPTEGSASSGSAGDCVKGIAPNLSDPESFYLCAPDGHKFPQKCPGGLVFDRKTLNCNYKS